MIHLTEDYLTVFEANASKLGMLPVREVTAFVRFHLLTKTLIDSFKPGSPWSSGEHNAADLEQALEYTISAFEELDGVLEQIETFSDGASMASLPKLNPSS